MKSPFPGLDPFIEGCGLWEDFHGHLIEKIGETLTNHLPPKYVVRTGERSYVMLAEDDRRAEHSFKPDVSVLKGDPTAGETATAIAEPLAAPFSLRAYIEDEFRERFIEIRQNDDRGQLVTCIEVLSPSNKKPNSPGWDLYQRKRQSLFMGHNAHLVEIDLLRGGQAMPIVDAWPDSPYRLLVARRQRMPYCQVWDVYFDRPLPVIPIPLLQPDPDGLLDLQPLINAIYSRWRYRPSIDTPGR